MKTRIRKWGNSAGAIIPSSALARAGLALGDHVDMVAENGMITIKTPTPRYSLDELLDATPAESTSISEEDRNWLDCTAAGRELL